MDADHAERLSVMLAGRMGNALIAPTIKVGCSSHHLTFAGTISLHNETFEAICRDYCLSLARHGFKRIFFFSGHIGNFPVLHDILPRLQASVAGRCEVDAFVNSETWLAAWRSAVAAAGGDADKVGGHADIAETSLMMAIRPESVRHECFAPGHIGTLTQEQLGLIWRDGISTVTANGILGDPSGSTPAIGSSCLGAIADLLMAAFSNR
jgi:creatinine amidohydrolase